MSPTLVCTNKSISFYLMIISSMALFQQTPMLSLQRESIGIELLPGKGKALGSVPRTRGERKVEISLRYLPESPNVISTNIYGALRGPVFVCGGTVRRN